MDGLEPRAAADNLAVQAARPFEKDRRRAANQGIPERLLLGRQATLKSGEALCLYLVLHLALRGGGRRARTT
jgi:hypothetical protein